MRVGMLCSVSVQETAMLMMSGGTGLVVSAIAVLLAITVLKQVHSKYNRSEVNKHMSEKGYSSRLILMKNDTDVGMCHAITTLTFFKGRVFPVASMKKKVQEILQRNMWLCSRLVSDTTHRYVAMYPNKYIETLIHDHFHVAMDKYIDHDMDRADIIKKAEEFLVKPGTEKVDKNLPLFRVTICRSSKGFALCVSLCHIIGDGATFYKLYGMLSLPAAVYSLVPERMHIFDSYCKGIQSKKLMQSPLVLLNALKLRVLGPSMQAKTFAVDAAWIARRKAEIAKGSGGAEDVYVSTNDILTSWISCITGVSFAVMAVNFRNRVSGITAEHAGNYEQLVMYLQQEVQHPLQIRQSLQYFHSESNEFISVSQQCEWNGVMFSNWTSLYEEIDVHGCEHVEHLPMVAMFPPFRNVALIYSPRKGCTAVIIASRSENVFHAIAASKDKPVGEIVRE